jgi:hypothetical protein
MSTHLSTVGYLEPVPPIANSTVPARAAPNFLVPVSIFAVFVTSIPLLFLARLIVGKWIWNGFALGFEIITYAIQ